ncbi:MAG: hypothetical protein RL660_3130 [Bacteroidota bacterium]|jgi:hypothetical protein
MKKVIIGTTLGFCATVSILLASCGKAVDCSALVIEVSTKGQAYVNANGTANETQACKDYVAALEKWLAESKCYDADPTAKATYEGVVASLKTECP